MILETEVPSIFPLPGPVVPWQRIGRALLILCAALAIEAAAWTARPGTAPPLAVPAAVEPVIVPAVPTDGVIAFTIPRGATDVQQAGGRAYIMPAAMRLYVGDRVIVRNDDLYPHMIFTMLVMPGTTETMTFDEPGIHPYSSGCAAHGGMLNAFTSVIVSER
jgi:plastocyanin